MPTLNVDRTGYIRGTGSTNYTTARTSNGTIAVDGAAGNVSNPIMAFFSSGRGGGTYLFQRTYLYFDITGIHGTVTSATLKITGVTNSAANVVVADGNNAFGGDGNTALSTSDFNEVDIGGSPVLFSGQTAWSTSLNSITLNSTALTALSSGDDIVFCVLNGTHDYNTNAQSSTVQSGIAFNTTIQLEYAVASAGITSVNTIARANISRFNFLGLASIDQINGIDAN